MSIAREPTSNLVLYRASLANAAQEGRPLMEKMVDAARYSLMAREGEMRQFTERNAVTEAIRMLNKHAVMLVESYPQVLREAFAEAENPTKPKLASLMDLRFDQLELMDDAQVQDRIELARAQQTALLAVEAPLANVTALLSAVQGFGRVVPERNPLRPDVYIRALQDVIQKTQAPAAMRTAWMQHMCQVLGKELVRVYEQTAEHLRAEGVRAAGYGVGAGGGGAYVPPSSGQRAAADLTSHASGVWTADAVAPAVRQGSGVQTQVQYRPPGGIPAVPAGDFPRLPDIDVAVGDELLTVDALRQLLAGELDAQASAGHDPRAGTGTGRNRRAEDSLPSDFQNTVPAAFDALAEMGQIDQAMDRLAQRSAKPRDRRATGNSTSAWRQQLRHDSRGAGQSLGIEVVGLMIENIVKDPRLLPPVQQAVRELEPALMQLVLVDPRFFSDREHPARRLLEEMTQRSLAYSEVQAAGFRQFMKPLRTCVDALSVAVIESAQPFEAGLAQLMVAWDAHNAAEREQREKAVQALLHAEQRNLLAEKIRADIRSWPDAAQVPPEVMEFVCGPWAQVIAQARLSDTIGVGDPGGYSGLVANLFWSAQPAVAHNNLPRLAKLIPGLLAKLRAGLKTIDYPPVQASAFFEKLVGLHQQGFGAQRADDAAAASDGVAAPPAPPAEPGAWLAPEEAASSGYVELGPDEPAPARRGPVTSVDAMLPLGEEVPPSAPAPLSDGFDLGTWVELRSEQRWLRTQLTWASPHGTLFLFTAADGSTQSMTRRMRDRLLNDGSLRVVSSQPVVDGALDAVAQAAMRNSLDARR